MHLNSFERKMENFNGLYRLNLAIQEENEYYLESIGGEDNLKNNYPMLYESYLSARRMAEISQQSDAEPDNRGIHFRTYDIMAVDSLTDGAEASHRYFLSMSLTGSFLDTSSTPAKCTAPAKSFSVSVNGKLYDPQSSRLAYISVSGSYQRVNQVDERFYSENSFGQEEFWNRELKARFTVSVYDEENNLTPFVSVETKRFGKPMNFAIDNISIEHPISSNPQTNEIRILYGRSAKHLEYPDYTYESNNADQNGGKLWTIVQMKGEVRLKSVLTGDRYYSFEKLTEPTTGELYGRSTLQYADKDWKVFRNDLQDNELYKLLAANNFSVSIGANNVETLSFDLFNPTYSKDSERRYDWAADIDKASTDNKERICYLVGGFEYDICKKNEKGEIVESGTSYQIELHSIKPENLPAGRTYYTYLQGSTIIYIPPIHLWWGCYGKDTQIMLADGTTKRADEIRMGDLLFCCGDKMLRVANIFCGNESNLFRVETDCGNSICVSAGHPMLLADGKGKAVETLTVGEELLMWGQARTKVTSITRVGYNDTVYNFTFQGEDDGNYLIANRFYSGDFYAQNKLEKIPVPLTEEQERLDNEMADLMVQLQGKVK